MTKTSRQLGTLVALALGVLGSVTPSGAVEPATYVNPVSRSFSDTFADPAVIKGKDGYWYAYATSDPLRAGGRYHLLPMARSDDLVNWTYVGDAFDASNAPAWMAVPEMWAPDIAYIGGRYHLYYVVTDTRVTDNEFDTAIGVATAPTPTGPWTDSGGPVVGPREDPEEPGSYMWTFDPDLLTARDGSLYLYYGSYYGGIYVIELSSDGLRTVGKPTQVAINDRYEGAYVIDRGGYYYLFASNGDCCAGPTTGYSVFVGRSRGPRGPFVDRNGDTMIESRVGGTNVIQPNGNFWVGTGHNSIVTDLSGQDWLAYHAIDRRDPYLEAPFEINERPMLIDRLDWIDGWPTVRGGHWASQGPRTAPVTQWDAGSEFNDEEELVSWNTEGGSWRVANGVQALGYARQEADITRRAYLTSIDSAPAQVRAEADLRFLGLGDGGSAGLVASYKDSDNHVSAWIDRSAGELTSEVVVNGNSRRRITTPLPASFRFGQWHNLAIELRGTEMIAEVTDARLNDPVAVQHRRLPELAVRAGSVGVVAEAARIAADNVGASRLFDSQVDVADVPVVGRVDATFSAEFNGKELGSAWTWVRSPDGRLENGVFRWPTQDADLFHDDNSASVLLRDAPAGNYTVETKLTIDLGVYSDKSFQQAGLIAYENDDLFVRLDHIAVFNTRQTEFLKEKPYAGDFSDGAMAVGTPARVTWLRIAHKRDPVNREHEFRAASSRDGEHWTWGGVWTLPPEASPRIGLVSLGGAGSTARFDYFKVFRQ